MLSMYKCDHSSFNRSRDMVGAHQNLNGSRDLTTPLSWMFCHPWTTNCYLLSTCLPEKFEVSISAHYENIKGIQKVENGVVWSS